LTGVTTSRSTHYQELAEFLQHVGKDPSRLLFEDELTGIQNRRFLRGYLEHKVRWEGEEDYPLSLIILDLDHFKQVNDTQGHDTGDQVLTWTATLLKDVAGEQGIPIRFAGDEFIVLLPRTDRAGAREIADRLLQRTRDRPFTLRDTGTTLSITLSIGVASAPDDGRDSKALFQAADTALYHAKQSGRNQAASAGEVDPKKVFPKTALHRLIATGIAGRDDQLAVVSEALEALTRGDSQFMLVEGGPGMGKTAFLDTVRSNLAGNDSYSVTRVSGEQQEGFRPYYLTSRVLVALLSQRTDGGEPVLQKLSKRELGYLSHILPQVADQGTAPPEQDETLTRQGIFAALARFLPRLVDFRPLILVVDDLHFADEASLLLIRALIQRKELNLFVCGSSLEALQLVGEEEAPPLERFTALRQRELGIRRVKLKPLSGDDIGEYLRGVFPSLKMPQDFESELARTTQGNPLFLAEIIRKLVADRRVTLEGQAWVINPLEDGYLPRSLEEIVMQKISALDEEGRQLLERATAMGEEASVSMLAGSSEVDENRVLEFLDRAEALGLVSLDFQINDEVMHFLGKQVAEISYGVIHPDRRQELHERIGEYQEGLYERRLLPSASLLAYHFKRSANQQKARRYERVQLANSQTVFDPEEAAGYTGELIEAEVEVEERLAPETVPLVPNVLRTFNKAVRAVQLYPPESRAVGQSITDVKEAVDRVLDGNERLRLSQDQRVLLANGQRIDVSEFGVLSDAFLEMLTRAELQGIAFLQGVTEAEIQPLITTLTRIKPEALTQGYWKSFIVDHALDHIELEQVRYSRVVRKSAGRGVRQPTLEEVELAPEELTRVPEILRAFQGAAKIVKLYPMDSNPVVSAIERLHASLQGVLTRHHVLTLAGVEQSLLVNGARIDTAGFEAVASAVVDHLRAVGLTSITFLANVPQTEVATFAGALREAPAGADPAYWDGVQQDHSLSGIAFNQRQYAVGVIHGLLSVVEGEDGEELAEGDAAAELAQRLTDEPSEALVAALPRFGKELLVKGEHDLVRRLLKRMFDEFQNQDPLTRERTVQACHALLDLLILGLQRKLAELGVESLLRALADETEPQVLREFGVVLHTMAGLGVQFGDYAMAGRILMALKTRRQEIEDTGLAEAASLVQLLDRPLDPTVKALLVEDLRSGEPDRRGRAAQLIGSLDRSGVPLLIEAIRLERDFRTRQMAATLLSEMGPHGARELKRALATETITEQRFRMLEIADTVTSDMRDELEAALADDNSKVRRAAFRMFQRLHRDELIELIVPYATDVDPQAAKGAVRSLAELGSARAVEALVTILGSTQNSTVAIACCQGLGQIGDAACIDPLSRVLGQRKFLFFGRHWDEQVRAQAAASLKQIPTPKAAEALGRFAKDRNGRVRSLARAAAAEQSS
jgi:diguanylate cyclase (GGDEF)-like protein